MKLHVLLQFDIQDALLVYSHLCMHLYIYTNGGNYPKITLFWRRWHYYIHHFANDQFSPLFQMKCHLILQD